MLQLPTPELSAPLQVTCVEPSVAVTVTEPLGAVAVVLVVVGAPLTLNPTPTACPTFEGFGVLEIISVTLAAFVAEVVSVLVGAAV
jgi:hypothetical protein